MTKRNMWLGVGLVVIIAAVVIFLITNKSDDNATNGSTATSQKSTTTSAQIITTKTDSTLGDYLADGSDQPLYTYGADTSGVSNCSGSCLVSWPIYAPTSSSSSLPANVTVITRSDGKAQYAYKGMPLYTFTADSTTPTGDGVSDFHIATP